MNVDEIIAGTINREGGYVNDPDDPGGATNFGVTIGTMRGLNIDIDGDGDVDVDDVKLLTADRAASIYKNHYFFRPKINLLPEPLRASVFDMYVNAGGNAIKILQRLSADFGEVTTVDGALGPNTAARVQSAYDKSDGFFVDAYGIARRNYYYALADRRPRSRKYATTRAGKKGGWIVRAEEFVSAKYDFTDAQHRERVSSWV